MKTTIIKPGPGGTIDSVCLFDIIDRLSESLEPLSLSKSTVIINDVAPDLFVGTDKNLVASVLGNMLNQLINGAESDTINISAKLYGNVVLLHLKNLAGNDLSAISQNLQAIQPMLDRLKGFVGITSHRNNRTTLAFSFVNMLN